MNIFTLHFDGSCGPKNPGGTAAYGYTLHRGAELLEQGNKVIGTGPGMSNNLAEFAGLAAGLKALLLRFPEPFKGIVNVRGDSKLVINIMARVWKPRPEKLYWPAYVVANRYASTLRGTGTQISFDWVPRELNTHCDALSKYYDNLSQELLTK